VLQDGRSQLRFPVVSLAIWKWPIPSVRIQEVRGLLSVQQKWIPKNSLRGKVRSASGADNSAVLVVLNGGPTIHPPPSLHDLLGKALPLPYRDLPVSVTRNVQGNDRYSLWESAETHTGPCVALQRNESLTSRPGRFTPRKVPSTQCVGGKAGYRVSLNVVENRENFEPVSESLYRLSYFD
jgi:hypothetical protein